MEELVARRVKRLKALMAQGVNPFHETEFKRNYTSREVKEKFSNLKNEEETKVRAQLAGRLFSIRFHGGIAFADLRDFYGKIQLMFRKGDSPKAFEFVEKYLDEGDIVGVDGTIVKTKRGEISILVNEVKLLSKALRPIPSEWYGVKDVEIRYRQRYLDLIMNPENRDLFAKISTAVNAMRRRLLDEGYVEVNTPILQAIYGGALAKPFKTFHNYLKQDMYLRIAPELYLKRLIVGGFEKVFEVAPCFRNESVDSTHNPEFIQIELYEAYVNYERMMAVTEQLVEEAATAANGTTDIVYQGRKLSLKSPWKRMKMVDAIKKLGGVDIEGKTDAEIRKIAGRHGVKETGGRLGDVIEALFSEVAAPKLMQPTFITHFPSDISALAKKFSREGGRWAQRFEGYIAGTEICNAFSEMNDPIQQYSNFKQEEAFRKKSKIKELEYMPMDKDYIRAMEYGMPPIGGLGLGLGRIFSVLFDRPSIKEVMLFPFMAGIEDIKTVSEMFPDLDTQ